MIKYLVFERYLLRYLADRDFDIETVKRTVTENAPNRLERLRLLAGHASEKEADPLLGLTIGQQATTAAYGVLGHAQIHSSSLISAMKIVLKHLWVLHPSSKDVACLNITRDFVQLRYIAPPIWPELPDFFLDLFFSAQLGRAQELTNDRLAGAFIELQRDRPKHAVGYEKKTGVPVRFGAEWDQISIPRAIAEAPLASSSIMLSRAYRDQCDAMLMDMNRSTSLAENIRQMIMRQPRTCSSMADIAAQLNISTRTLRRRLDAEGDTFRSINREVRFHLARNYLIDTNLSVLDISDLVGYFDAATFSRAFTIWSGKTPRAYRRSYAKEIPR